MALSGTTAESRGEGDGLGLSVTKYRTGTNADELDNRANITPHYSDLRDAHTAAGEQGADPR